MRNVTQPHGRGAQYLEGFHVLQIVLIYEKLTICQIFNSASTAKQLEYK